METRYTGTASLPVLAATAILLTACASTTPDGGVPLPPIEPIPDIGEELASARKEIATLEQERSRLEKSLKKSRERNRELKLELLDRTALVHQLEAEKERAIEAVVQAKARLRSRQSKAETVANLAEMKLALQQAAEESSGSDQASLRSRERFWDIRVPKIDSIFDNSLVPRPSWSPGVPPQHRKLVAATHRSPI